MSFLGRQLVKNVLDPGGNPMPPEPAIQFVSSASATSVTVKDNPALGATVVTIPGGGGGGAPAFGGSWNTNNVPAAASYTVTGSMALYDTGGGALFAIKANQSNAQMDTALIAATFPASGWWVELACNDLPMDFGGQYPGIGVAVATGTGAVATAVTMIRFWDNTSNGILPRLQGQHSHPGAGIIGGALNGQTNEFAVDKFGSVLRHRLLSDGTNQYYQISYDGFWWLNWFSEGLTGSLAFWGFCLGNASGTGTTGRLVATILRNVFHNTLTVAPATITNVANTTPIQVTAPAHGLLTGDTVSIHGCSLGAVNTTTGSALINLWVVIVLDANNVQLVGTTASGTGSGGTITCLSR